MNIEYLKETRETSEDGTLTVTHGYKNTETGQVFEYNEIYLPNGRIITNTKRNGVNMGTTTSSRDEILASIKSSQNLVAAAEAGIKEEEEKAKKRPKSG